MNCLPRRSVSRRAIEVRQHSCTTLSAVIDALKDLEDGFVRPISDIRVVLELVSFELSIRRVKAQSILTVDIGHETNSDILILESQPRLPNSSTSIPCCVVQQEDV